MTAKKTATARPKRRPYRSPKLAVHGDLRTLTATKGSNKADGGKPATRNAGSPA
jgi:hypothetical protein